MTEAEIRVLEKFLLKLQDPFDPLEVVPLRAALAILVRDALERDRYKE